MKAAVRKPAAWRWMVVCAVGSLVAALVPVVQGGPASGAGDDLDSGYGDGGVALVDAGLVSEEAGTLSLMPGGDIVVVGSHRELDDQDFPVQRVPLVRFDSNGRPMASAGDGSSHGLTPIASAPAPDGKLVVAAAASGDTNSVTVVRYLASGALDPGFGSGGIASLTGLHGRSLYGHALAVAVAPDGSVLVAGRVHDYSGAPWDLVVGRLRPDGRSDPAFGDGGAVVLGIEDQDGNRAHLMGQSVVRLPDGRIVVAGTLVDQYGAREFLARFTVRGDFDRSFNKGVGFTVGPVGDDWGEIVDSVAVLPDGRAVVGGTRIYENTADLFVRRHLADGRVDPSFAGGVAVSGDPTIDEIMTGLALDAAGRVVFAGSAAKDGGPADVLVGRHLPDGRADAAFAGGGLTRLDLGAEDITAGLALDQGRPLLAATTTGTEGGDIALLRFTDAGQPDASFGGNGQVLHSLAGFADWRSGMAVGPDGAVVSVGAAGLPSGTRTGNQGVVVRQRPDGRADEAFRRRGVAFVGSGQWSYTLNDAVVLPDGSTVVVGGRMDLSYQSERVVLRLRPDGSPDPAFGNNGEVVEGRPNEQRCCEPYEAVAVTPDGRLRALVVRPFGDEVIIAGYLPDGRPDPEFGTGGLAVIRGSHVRQPWNLVVTADGGLLAGGGDPDSAHFEVFKLTAAGQRDETFAPDLSTSATARFRAMAPGPDGTVIVAGTRTSREDGSTQLVVRRLTADGRPDPRFDCDGETVTAAASAGRTLTITGVVIGPDGRIAVGGRYHDGTESYHEPAKEVGVFAARWLADGTHDPSFSNDGVASNPIVGRRVTVTGLGLVGDSPVMAGTITRPGERRSDGFTVRFSPGGPAPAPEPAVDRLIRCGTTALSAGDIPGVLQAVTVTADQLLPVRPTPPAPPAPPTPVPPASKRQQLSRSPLRTLATDLLPPGSAPAVPRAPAGSVEYAPFGAD